MTERYSFADDVIAALNNPKRGFFVLAEANGLPATKSRLAETYHKMRAATRYALDDDFVDFAMEASMRATIGDLLEQYKLVARPDNLMWLEWNEEKRQQTLLRVAEEMGDEVRIDWSAIVPRVGYLFDDAPFTGYEGEAFIGTSFCRLGKEQRDRIATCPHSILFAQMADDPDESGFTRDYARFGVADFFNMPQEDVTEAMVDQQLSAEMKQFINGLGPWWAEKQKRVDPEAAGVALLSLSRHMRMIQGPGIDCYVDVSKNDFDSEKAKRLNDAADEMTNGDMRFLVTVISMLNYDWVIKERREAEPQRKYRYGRFHKGNSHIVLSIDLPKFQGVTVMPKGFGKMEQSSRRQHSVRGHWRVYKKDGRRVWIAPHLRGDPKLGVITKDYALTNRR